MADAPIVSRGPVGMAPESARIARRLVEVLGGRYSTEMGIAADRGPDEIERWFLAATLFANPIPAGIVARTYRSLADAGIRTIADVAEISWDDLVSLLDRGGYARYDFRTATRLLGLARYTAERWNGRLASALLAVDDPVAVEAMLDALPGWGPTTVRIFLRELRGVWAGAWPRLDERALRAAEHLELAGPADRPHGVAWLESLAACAALDPRDLEGALIRLSLAHRRRRGPCPGRERCRVLQAVR